MEEQEIFKRLEGRLRNPDHFPDLKEGVITPETKFKDLELDSLDFYELIYAVEEEFNMHIPEEKAYQFETVRDYINYIKQDKKN